MAGPVFAGNNLFALALQILSSFSLLPAHASSTFEPARVNLFSHVIAVFRHVKNSKFTEIKTPLN